MTTDPTPSPDVRELAAKAADTTLLGLLDEGFWYGDYVRDLVAEHVIPAVLAAVSPVIRRQVAEEIAEAKRRLFSRIIASAHLLDVPFSNAPDQSPWTLLKRDMNALTAAIARTHAHSEEGK